MQRLAVLIVDNSAGIAKQLETALTEYDPLHALRTATSPEQALGLVHSFHPDLIIYDMPLTGSGDAQVIADMKASFPGARIIAISLYEHYGIAALSAGADEFVSKTAPRASLLAALKRQCAALGTSKAE